MALRICAATCGTIALPSALSRATRSDIPLASKPKPGSVRRSFPSAHSTQTACPHGSRSAPLAPEAVDRPLRTPGSAHPSPHPSRAALTSSPTGEPVDRAPSRLCARRCGFESCPSPASASSQVPPDTSPSGSSPMSARPSKPGASAKAPTGPSSSKQVRPDGRAAASHLCCRSPELLARSQATIQTRMRSWGAPTAQAGIQNGRPA